MNHSEKKLMIVRVNGMTCKHCEITLESALKEEIQNIIDVKANRQKKMLKIHYIDNIDMDEIKSVIEENSFKILE
jgi:copper chaperone CopZ